MINAKQKRTAGSTLIEIIIATGVVGLVMTAIVSVMTVSVKNTAQSKAAALGTKYTQEALEFFRREENRVGWETFLAKFPAGGGSTTYCLNTIPASLAAMGAGSCPASQFVDQKGLFTRYAVVKVIPATGQQPAPQPIADVIPLATTQPPSTVSKLIPQVYAAETTNQSINSSSNLKLLAQAPGCTCNPGGLKCGQFDSCGIQQCTSTDNYAGWAAPTQTSPADGAQVLYSTTYTTLKWTMTGVSSAFHGSNYGTYRVYFDTNPSPTTMSKYKSLSICAYSGGVDTCTLNILNSNLATQYGGVLNGRTFYWKVQPENACFSYGYSVTPQPQVGTTSPTRSFTYVASLTPSPTPTPSPTTGTINGQFLFDQNSASTYDPGTNRCLFGAGSGSFNPPAGFTVTANTPSGSVAGVITGNSYTISNVPIGAPTTVTATGLLSGTAFRCPAAPSGTATYNNMTAPQSNVNFYVTFGTPTPSPSTAPTPTPTPTPTPQASPTPSPVASPPPLGSSNSTTVSVTVYVNWANGDKVGQSSVTETFQQNLN